ncbi:hypothetical protein JCM19992_33230 [Thermostilla marina]
MRTHIHGAVVLVALGIGFSAGGISPAETEVASTESGAVRFHVEVVPGDDTFDPLPLDEAEPETRVGEWFESVDLFPALVDVMPYGEPLDDFAVRFDEDVVDEAAGEDAASDGPELGVPMTDEKAEESVDHSKSDAPEGGAPAADQREATEPDSQSQEAKEETPNEEKPEPVGADREKQREKVLREFGQAMADALDAKVGHPEAAGIAALLRPEIETQLESRRIDSRFRTFRSYLAGRLRATDREYTGSEVNGLCRLSWYEQLYLDPLSAPAAAEEFTRKLHAGLKRADAVGTTAALAVARPKMDVPAATERFVLPKPASPEEAVLSVQSVLLQAHRNYAAMIEPLEEKEVADMARNLYSTLTTNASVGHTVNSRSYARRLCKLMLKMNRSAQFDLAETLAQLLATDLLTELAKLDGTGDASLSVEGITGPIVRVIETETGTIVIGGSASNQYDLETAKQVRAVIDLGGNDVYLEGTANVSRPVLIVIDLAGDDRYQGKQPGIQGGSLLAGSILIDASGDDVYQAQSVAQGSTLAGVGILADLNGNDRYVGLRRVQGQALGGVGLLIEGAGTDDYHAAMWDQGFAGPLGFGVLEDISGNDHYYTGGRYYDSYPETPGYEGWGQGVGSGLRGVADGGLGVLLEGSGDDTYEYDYFAQGGGYWLGMGFARDFEGNDNRLGATLKAYTGSSRTERRFQRFANGFGCHYALGFLIDDAGNDAYGGTIMNIGFAWDASIGVLMEFAGDDQYLATGSGSQGSGAQGSLGILFDYRGADIYKGYGQGYASSNITYHNPSACGGNFSFVIDYGNTDTYGCRAANNRISRRGTSGGFIVDRPAPGELEATTTAAEK